MNNTSSPSPKGCTRISNAVVDKLIMTAAHDVQGVVDIHGLLLGAVIGGVAGGVIGFIEGGPVGCSIGTPVGTALGAATGHALQAVQDRHTFFNETDTLPPIRLRLTAEYGADLPAVAEEVRQNVAHTLERHTGFRVDQIAVEFIEISPPSR